MSRKVLPKNTGQTNRIASLNTTEGVQQRKQIDRLCRAIAVKFRPDKIILFGSHAYGTPRSESDVDLLIVMPFEGSPFRQAGVVLDHVVQTVGVMPLDLLVRTPQQVQERIQMGDSFMREILEHGQIIYEADHP